MKCSLLDETKQPAASNPTDSEIKQQHLTVRDFSDKISHAFQLATAQGPLCSEPIQGIAVFLEDVTVTTTGEEELSRLTGEAIKSVREAISQGFLDWSPRLLLAMYSCEIQASSKPQTHLILTYTISFVTNKPHPQQPKSSAASTAS